MGRRLEEYVQRSNLSCPTMSRSVVSLRDDGEAATTSVRENRNLRSEGRWDGLRELSQRRTAEDGNGASQGK